MQRCEEVCLPVTELKLSGAAYMDRLSSEEVTFPPLSFACLSVMLTYDDDMFTQRDMMALKQTCGKTPRFSAPQQSLCYIKINVTLHLV